MSDRERYRLRDLVITMIILLLIVSLADSLNKKSKKADNPSTKYAVEIKRIESDKKDIAEHFANLDVVRNKYLAKQIKNMDEFDYSKRMITAHYKSYVHKCEILKTDKSAEHLYKKHCTLKKKPVYIYR